MAGRTQLVEWTICDTDGEWQQRCGATEFAPAPPGRGFIPARAAGPRKWALALLLVTLLPAVGVWCWRTGKQTLAQDAAELQSTLHLEQWAVAQQDAQVARLTLDAASRNDRQTYAEEFATLVRAETSAPLSATLDLLDVAGETAVVQVRWTAAAGAGYRQARFYRRGEGSWLRIAPNPTLWGPWRTWQTEHFIWRYRQQDMPVVTAVADRADALAVTIARTFGLALTAPLSVTVAVDAPPVTVAADGSILLASPAVYLAPGSVPDEDLLLQALALALIQITADRTVPAVLVVSPWQTLADAISLWQLWQLDLPLAQWEQPLVQWVYVAPPLDTAPAREALTTDLCAAHRLWVEPAALHIPLLCVPNPAPAYAIKQMIPPATVLAELTEGPNAPASGDVGRSSHPGTTVALATLVDYLATAYGPERLPDLLAALPAHTTWDDLLPAVYGVSAAEVQIGWYDHLAAVCATACTGSSSPR